MSTHCWANLTTLLTCSFWEQIWLPSQGITMTVTNTRNFLSLTESSLYIGFLNLQQHYKAGLVIICCREGKSTMEWPVICLWWSHAEKGVSELGPRPNYFPTAHISFDLWIKKKNLYLYISQGLKWFISPERDKATWGGGGKGGWASGKSKWAAVLRVKTQNSSRPAAGT